jgi:hypothetical protein
MLESLVQGVEDGTVSLGGQDQQQERLSKLFVAADGDEMLSNRLLLAVQAAIPTNPDIVLGVLQSNMSIFDRHLLETAITLVPMENLHIWEAIARSAASVESGEVSTLLAFLRSGRVGDALALLFTRPSMKSLIARALSAQDPLPLNGLSAAYLVCMQDSPQDSSILGEVILLVLTLHAHPLIHSTPFSTRLAWMEFCQRDAQTATRVVRRMAKISGLLGDGDTGDMVLLSTLY